MLITPVKRNSRGIYVRLAFSVAAHPESEILVVDEVLAFSIQVRRKNMKSKVILTAKGEVQRVGYRDIVERIARKLELVGCVENVEPYDVKIICEGEKDIVEEFIRQINIKDDRILVESIDIKYEEPTNEFTFFKIIRGDLIEELGERFDRANYDLKIMSEKQTETVDILKENTGILKENTSILKDNSNLLKENTSTLKENTGLLKENTSINKDNSNVLTSFKQETNNNLTHFREDTNHNFTELDSKYHVISEDMRSLKEDIHKLTEAMITIAQARACC